jgi:hypothetical protein
MEQSASDPRGRRREKGNISLVLIEERRDCFGSRVFD